MVKTLRESKAKLSELVERASRGEDVLITVRGRVKARLTGVQTAPSAQDRAVWVKQLRAFQKSIASGGGGLPIEEILDQDREDRI